MQNAWGNITAMQEPETGGFHPYFPREIYVHTWPPSCPEGPQQHQSGPVPGDGLAPRYVFYWSQTTRPGNRSSTTACHYLQAPVKDVSDRPPISYSGLRYVQFEDEPSRCFLHASLQLPVQMQCIVRALPIKHRPAPF